MAAAHRRSPELSANLTSTVRALVNLGVLVVLARGDVRGLFGDGRRALWGRAFFGATALLCYFAAIHLTSAGEAAFLNQTSAVWVAALAPLVLGERTPAWTWLAIVGSVVGAGMLAHPRPDEGLGVGRVLGLVSGLLAAGAYVSLRRASASNPARVVVFYFTVVSTVIAGSLAVVEGAPPPTDPLTWAFLVGAGVTATLAQLEMTEAYTIGPASTMAAVGAATPMLTALSAWIFLGDTPDTFARAGMAVLLASGVAMPLVSASDLRRRASST